MYKKSLDKLEYKKMIDVLIKYAKTYIGKENILALKPYFSKLEVTRLLSQTNEATSLMARKTGNPMCEIPNIQIWIKQLESNRTLTMKALLETAHILKISRELKEYFFADNDFKVEDFPLLTDLFNLLYTNKSIEEKILVTILDEDNISDNASKKLNSLRRQSRKLEQDIRDKLTSFIHSSSNSKYIMEPLVTIRNDRYVIPIKEEYKNTVKGFIHDISSSGSTVFIEPLSVFELNNEIANIKMEELREIERILQELSSIISPYSNYLKTNIDIIGKLDVIFAKAAYSVSINGIMPIINKEKQINLIKARHPLIAKENIVPIDIEIGKTYKSLVITGPNTGGKTVTLKTVGLVLLMAYSGIFVPCKENSSIYIFDNIYADIGDEQSIQESLSTFSSHMANIINITENVTQNSLVLLDELGSGTDPIEGANLAVSILKYLYNLGSLCISTTHYPELKHYSLLNHGFENASQEFDIENLKPTYKLLIGIPGKSYAFAISKRLGLKQEILDNAISLAKDDEMSIEELMKKIYDNNIKIQKEKEEIEKNSIQIENLRKTLEKERQKIKEKEAEIIQKAKSEARDLLLSSKKEANEIIKELRSLEANQKTKAEHLRNKLNDKLNAMDINSTEKGLNLEALKEFNQKFSLKNNKKDSKGNKNNSKVTFSKNTLKAQTISSEINVIGMNVDEAIFAIDKYIDNCVIAKLSPIRIVHGKGTGKLREGIHKYLKTNSHVQSFRLGTFGEGEMGVTIVEL